MCSQLVDNSQNNPGAYQMASHWIVRCVVVFLLLFLSILPRPVSANSLSFGLFNQGVYSGTAPFNVTGICTNPGDDCNDVDVRIRTSDLLQYSWSITAANIPFGAPDFASVILEQTLRPESGAKIIYNEIPTICLAPPQGPGGVNPASSITNHPDGSITLLCNLGSMANGNQRSFTVPVRPLATSLNGATFTTEQNVYALDDVGNQIVSPVTYTDNNVYEISSAPAFDLIGNRRPIYRSYVDSQDLGQGAGLEPGYVFYWTAHIAADQERAGKGIESLSDSISFSPGITGTKSDGVTPTTFPYKIVECEYNSSPWGNTVFGKETWAATNPNIPIEKKVVDSGDCTLEGDFLTGYTMNITGLDSTGSRYPTKTAGNTSLLAGPYFVGAYRLRIWVPFSAIDAQDGIPDNNTGSFFITSCLSDFDPVSGSGVSNYAAGFEPGYNGNPMPDGSGSNNCTGPVEAKISSGGTYNHRLVSTATDTGGYTYRPLIPNYHDGSAVVEPFTHHAHFVYYANAGSVSQNNMQMCVAIDNTTTKLTDRGNIGATPGTFAYIADHKPNGFDPSKWKVQYGTVAINNDDPLDNDGDGVWDFNSISGRFEGTWNQQRAVRCDDPSIINWSEDPTVVGIDNINVVRVVPVNSATTLDAGQQIRLFVPLEMRDSYNGGPYAGNQIEVGTVAPAFSTVRSDEFWPTWRNISYNPSPESSHGDGDRVTFTRVTVDVAKSTSLPLSPAGVPTSTLAGNDVVWQLDPTVSSVQLLGGTANNMEVIDILPAQLTYNQLCTQQFPGSTVPTQIEYNTPATGQTRLTWSLGDVHSSTIPSPIIFCTRTDPLAPAGTVALNTAQAKADNSALSRPAYQSVALGQAGSIQASVTVDVPLDNINDTQLYKLRWYNFSSAGLVSVPSVINVLPYIGDDTGLSARNPATNYAGTFKLTGEPVVTFSDGSLPAADEPLIGTLYYSADVPASIDHNADDNTSNWCEWNGTTFINPNTVGGVCPVAWSNVTAIKHVSNYELDIDGKPRQGMEMNYVMSALGNLPGNRYINVFGVDSDSLPADQYVKSKVSSVIIASYSIGDYVFVDLNTNGVFDAGIDLPAPDGITVELRDPTDNSLVESTTTKWLGCCSKQPTR